MFTVIDDAAVDETLAAIKEESGEDARLCYQCGKCSAGCPIHAWFDLPPNKVLHLLQLGRFDEVLTSRTAQLCASCYIGRLIDSARNICYKRGLLPVDGRAMTFHRTFLKNVRRHGRLNEVELAAFHNLAQLKPFADADIAPKLFFKGKLHIGLGGRADGEIGRIFDKTVGKL
jgi:heterodisulfide reductase subunit C